MRTFILFSTFLLGCQATSAPQDSTDRVRPLVPSNIYNTSICNMSTYDTGSCYERVNANIRREKQRRLMKLKEMDNLYRDKLSDLGYIDVFYTSYPSVNSKGESVPYNLFTLVTVISPPENMEHEQPIFVFMHGDYNYGLLWTPPHDVSTQLVQLGSPLSEFFDCAMLYSFDGELTNTSKQFYTLMGVQCN